MSAEARRAQEHGDRAERQVQVLGVRNQRQEDQQRQGVQPPVRAAASAFVRPATGRRDRSTIRTKIRKAMTPDSGETSPSHTGRTTKRRTNSPAMETATATAQTATKPK